jgi:hypothetical protein
VATRCPAAVRSAGQKTLPSLRFVKTVAPCSRVTRHLRLPVCGELLISPESAIRHTHDGRTSACRIGAVALAEFSDADGKVVEHWEVLQPVPASSNNANTMFQGLLAERPSAATSR